MLEQVRRKAVPDGVARGGLVDAGGTHCSADVPLHRLLMDVVAPNDA